MCFKCTYSHLRIPHRWCCTAGGRGDDNDDDVDDDDDDDDDWSPCMGDVSDPHGLLKSSEPRSNGRVWQSLFDPLLRICLIHRD